MLKNISRCFVCFILLNALLANNTLKLGTSSIGGTYSELGKLIISVLENNEFDHKIEIVNSEGSVDNIYKLKNDEIDLAIVQNDIAFLAENGFQPFDHIHNNIRGIITFYPEPIFLITNKPTIRSIEQLPTFKVNVGTVNSGLIADVKVLLNSIGIYDLIKKYHYRPYEIQNLLKQDIIDASFINNLNIEMKESIKNGDLHIISLENSLIQSLCKTYPYFDVYTETIDNDEINTVAVKAILVCNSTLDEQTINNLTRILYENYSNLSIPSENVILIKKNATQQMPLKNWHTGAFKYFNEIGILNSQNLLKYIWIALFIPMAIVLFLLITNLIIISINKSFPSLISVNSNYIRVVKQINIVINRYKYLVILLIMMSLLLTDIIIVQQIEHNWAIKNNITSNFDNNTFSKNLIWLFVWGSSGYYGDMFPNNPLAKLIVTLIPIIGIGGVISIIGIASSDYIKRKILESRGVQIKMIKNHIIICGWNEDTPYLINNLLNENLSHIKPIVLLADINEDFTLEKYNLDNSNISYIRGEATNKADLKRANIKDADIAIILSDTNSLDSDAKNILKILTIEKYCRELEISGARKNRSNIYTVAEIQDIHNIELANDAAVDEIILLGNIRSKIIAESVLNPGVSKFINEITTYNDYNDIYSIELNKNNKLIGLNFDEILTLLRKFNILLLSICVNNLDPSETEHDQMDRCVITNPINKKEAKYITKFGDRLIVLAQYEKVIDKALKKLS